MGTGVRSIVLIAAGCLALGGCGLADWANNGFQVGPNYRRPAAAVSESWIDSQDERVVEAPPLYGDWWIVFQDPLVNELVLTAYEQNLTLRQAGARILQARANRAIAVGTLFPQVQQAFGSYSRIQESENVALPAPLRTFDDLEVGFNASWEIDFWGRFRRSIESADAQLDGSVREYDAVLVSLIAEVVTAYVEIRTFQERLKYANQNVEVQRSSLDLSTDRFNEGKTSELGVFLAKASLNGTEATIPALRIGLRQANNRLCTLLGMPPSDLAELLGERDALPNVPAEIAVGIPADLLRRRPDVIQAERLVAEQSARIGIAVADLYPTISVVGEIYQASADFDDLFRSSSSAGLISPGFQWNILNYGRIRNNIRLQDTRLVELIAAYQNKVLQANQEVEDALVAFLESQREVEALTRNVDDLQNSLDLLLIQFEDGKINFSPIFVLQGSLRAAQDRLASAQGEILLNTIAVYRALGGGWQIRCPGFQPQGLMPLDTLPSPADEMQNSDELEFKELLLLPEPLLEQTNDE